MAENGAITNFTPTAKPKGTWDFLLLLLLSPHGRRHKAPPQLCALTTVTYFPTKKERGNINQGPRIRQGSRFSVRQFAIPPAVGPWCRRNFIPRRHKLRKIQTGLPGPNPKSPPAWLGGWMRWRRAITKKYAFLYVFSRAAKTSKWQHFHH